MLVEVHVIVVKVEMWPNGDENKMYPLGRMYIANLETTSNADPSRGDYLAAVCRRGTDAVPHPIDKMGPQATRGARIVDYPRLAYNMWRLIARALQGCFPEERGPKVTPVISPEVMRGLKLLEQHFSNDGRQRTLGHQWDRTDIDAVTAARHWLQAADDETYAG